MDVRCRNSKTGEERIFPQKVFEAVEEYFTFIEWVPDPDQCERENLPKPVVSEGSDLPQGPAPTFYHSPNENQASNQALIEELLKLREKNQSLQEENKVLAENQKKTPGRKS